MEIQKTFDPISRKSTMTKTKTKTGKISYKISPLISKVWRKKNPLGKYYILRYVVHMCFSVSNTPCC